MENPILRLCVPQAGDHPTSTPLASHRDKELRVGAWSLLHKEGISETAMSLGPVWEAIGYHRGSHWRVFRLNVNISALRTADDREKLGKEISKCVQDKPHFVSVSKTEAFCLYSVTSKWVESRLPRTPGLLAIDADVQFENTAGI